MARLTASVSAGARPGRNSLAAASAQASFALCSSVFMTNRRPASTTSAPKPRRTTIANASMIRVAPACRDRNEVNVDIRSFLFGTALFRRATDVDDSEAGRRRFEGLVIPVDRGLCRLAIHSRDRVGVLRCVEVDGLLYACGTNGF